MKFAMFCRHQVIYGLQAFKSNTRVTRKYHRSRLYTFYRLVFSGSRFIDPPVSGWASPTPDTPTNQQAAALQIEMGSVMVVDRVSFIILSRYLLHMKMIYLCSLLVKSR